MCECILRKTSQEKLHLHAAIVRSKQQHVKSTDVAWHRRSWPKNELQGDEILHKCQVDVASIDI